jgi:hypothetical protein
MVAQFVGFVALLARFRFDAGMRPTARLVPAGTSPTIRSVAAS